MRESPNQFLFPSLLTAALLLVVATFAPCHAQVQSDSFRLERVSLSSSGGSAASARFRTRIVLADSGPNGGMASACGKSWVQSVGFFSALTAGPVPIRLQVERTSLSPLAIELNWTGTASSFDVRRSFDPSTILDSGSVYRTIGSCETEDSAPTENDLIFYLVLPEGTTPARSFP